MQTTSDARDATAYRRARTAAVAAGALGAAYAVTSAYWALGGTRLLSTVGGSLGHVARDHRTTVAAGLWAVVLLKLVAAGLPLAAVGVPGRSARRAVDGSISPAPWIGRRRWIVRRLTKVEAVILTLYGLVLSTVGWLVQSGVLARGRHADQKALAWHAFLWDPWFLVWGLLVCGALRWSAPARLRGWARRPAARGRSGVGGDGLEPPTSSL